MADKDTPGFPEPARGPGVLVTSRLYEHMWEVYRDGSRTAGEIVTKSGVNHKTAMRAINHGWPKRQFRPLRDRAREHDQLRAEAERAAAMQKHREATDAWYKASITFNKICDNTTAMAMLAMQQITNLVVTKDAEGRQRLKPLTKWVRKRDPATGVVHQDEVPLTTQEAVKLQTDVLRAVEIASRAKQEWHVTSDAEKAAQTGPPAGLSSLTAEQLEYIIENRQFPPGVSAEDVYGAELEVVGKKGKRGQ
jgi:hypothetical protein